MKYIENVAGSRLYLYNDGTAVSISWDSVIFYKTYNEAFMDSLPF